MNTDVPPQRTIVIGAGPVGCLAALYAAERGDDVEVYDLRPDPRDVPVKQLAQDRSINMALSERGLNALRSSGDTTLFHAVLDQTIPMMGRAVHGIRNNRLTEVFQPYDVYKRYQQSVNRAALVDCLLAALARRPNVTVRFKHKLVSISVVHQTATFSLLGSSSEENVKFDLVIGADGAHSVTRSYLMKHAQAAVQQEYLDTVWCQFIVPAPAPGAQDTLTPWRLHIWPAGGHMFLALPNPDRTFTATMFVPETELKTLEASPADIVPFFQKHYPGVVPDVISPDDLVAQFKANPHLPIVTVQCRPFHFQSRAVILGDAAHAIAPFYGQGMNAGLEDVRILFGFLDKEMRGRRWASTAHRDAARASALAQYSVEREPDARAIAELSLNNFAEMRAHVQMRRYQIRKTIEETLAAYAPWIGWATQYSRVSFENLSYKRVQELAEFQGRVLGGVAMTAAAALVAGLIRVLMMSRAVRGVAAGLVRWASQRLMGIASRLER